MEKTEPWADISPRDVDVKPMKWSSTSLVITEVHITLTTRLPLDGYSQQQTKPALRIPSAGKGIE